MVLVMNFTFKPLLRSSSDKPAATVVADVYHPLPQYDLTMARSLGAKTITTGITPHETGRLDIHPF